MNGCISFRHTDENISKSGQPPDLIISFIVGDDDVHLIGNRHPLNSLLVIVFYPVMIAIQEYISGDGYRRDGCRIIFRGLRSPADADQAA